MGALIEAAEGRVRLLSLFLAVPACFGDLPIVDQTSDDTSMAGGSSGEENLSGETSSGDDGSSDGAMECLSAGPPIGCVDVLINGSFTEWFGGSPVPTSWDVPLGSSTRADNDACAPTLRVASGSPDEFDNVWMIEQDIADTTVPAGATVHFAATVESVSGEISELKICFVSQPDIDCQFAYGFGPSGRAEVSADFVTTESVDLLEFDLRSKYSAQEVLVDDLRLWVCPN
jgi:hypothetical protein